METRTQEDGTRIYDDELGSMRAYVLGNGVVMHVCRGVQVEEFARVIVDDGAGQLQSAGRCVLMLDAFESQRMTTQFRDRLTRWMKEHREKVRAHVLMQSRLLEMAIHVANLEIGIPAAHIYHKVADWEAVGPREVSGFRRRSSSGTLAAARKA